LIPISHIGKSLQAIGHWVTTIMLAFWVMLLLQT
jgi:hypothetical protein